MIREKLVEKNIGRSNTFRWRSHEISRIEGLSDTVFGFAVTILVISLEVPHTFHELMEKMQGFAAFAISFALLFWVWFNHYTFFRRYGLENTYTAWLTAGLLFVVLFYVYPLKFLFSWLVIIYSGGNPVTHLPNGTVVPIVEAGESTTLMIIYGIGFVAIFLVFILFYLHAYRKRVELELNEIELLETRGSIQANSILVCVGLVSIGIALFGGQQNAFLSGITYALIGPVMTIHGTLMGKRRKKLLAHIAKT